MSLSPISPEAAFSDAAQNWDLTRLYHDLATAKQKALTETEKTCLRGLLCSVDPKQIAATLRYSPQTLRVEFSRGLYRYIELIASGKVKNWASVPGLLEQAGYRLPRFASEAQAIAPALELNAPRQDWGEAPDTAMFLGRTQEIDTLTKWIVHDQCRLVTLLGMGGIGKTVLSVKLAEQIQQEFDWVVWRSLRDAPSLSNLLATLIRVLSNGQVTSLPETDAEKLSQLITYLNSNRCLLVLDNFETLFQTGTRVGNYRMGYEGYGDLLKRVGETRHRSCLLVTSREKPAEIAILEGETLPIREWQLQGLPLREGEQLLSTKGLTGTKEEFETLIQSYRGNPLALKITATSIQDLFKGNISEFLQQGTVSFNGIRNLLHCQIERLADVEVQIMYWLAINREPVSAAEIQADLIPTLPMSVLLESLESLRWRCLIETAPRSLIEKNADGFTLQPVILEYMTERLTQQVYEELVTDHRSATFNHQQPNQNKTRSAAFPSMLKGYALSKATAKEYIRNSQIQCIVKPLITQAVTQLGTEQDLADRLNQLLWQLRSHHSSTTSLSTTGYAAGNIINLLGYLQVDLTGADFSQFNICQAYLADIDLHRVNLAHANLSRSVFAETFGGISCVAFSPDGRFLTASDTGGESHIWDIVSGQQRLSFKTDAAWTCAIAFSPDGQLLASAGDDYLVKLWDAQTGDCLQVFPGHQHTIYAIAFSPDGQTLVSASQDATLRLWQLGNPERANPCLRILQGHEGRIWSVAFSPDGKTLASGAEDNTVKIWDAKTGTCLQTLTEHTHWLKAIAFSPDGHMLASGGFDCTIRLWATKTGECLQILQGHQDTVTTIAFSPNGRQLASSSYDQTVKVWDVSGHCLSTLHEHSNRVLSVAFSPNGQYLASGGDDHAARLWNLSNGQCTKTWKGHTNGILTLDASPNGQWFATGHQDQTVKIWHAETGRVVKTLRGHQNRVWAVAFAPESAARTLGQGKDAVLASCSGDRSIKLWNSSTGQCLMTLQGHSSWVWSVTFSPSGRWLASGSCDHTVNLWDIRTEALLRTFTGHGGPVVKVLFSHDERQLISSSADATIKIWDIRSGACLQTLEGHQNNVWAIALSLDGGLLASSSYDQTVKLWDLQTGTCLYTFTGHQGPVGSLAFSPDGQHLASGSFDQTIKLWNLQTKGCVQTFKGHTGVILCLVFGSRNVGDRMTHSNKHANETANSSEYESLLISGSFDETIKLWDVTTGKCLQSFRTPRPYEGMNITGTAGLNSVQRATLLALGAREEARGV